MRTKTTLGLFCGVLAPLVLNVTFLVEGHLRPDYDPVSQFISELSLGPRGFVQHLNFWITGTLLIVFSLTLRARFTQGDARRGANAIGAVGAGLFAAGLFDTDPFPMTSLSVAGALHDLAATVVFPSMIAACFFFWRYSRSRLALACGALTAFFYVLVVIGFPFFKPAPALLVANIGLLQRLAQGSFFLWLLSYAGRLSYNHAHGRQVGDGSEHGHRP